MRLQNDEGKAVAPVLTEKQPEDSEIILQASGIKRVFGRGGTAVTALSDIHLSVPRGAVVALKGRSGSGKTTLLNILSTLDDPTEGSVHFEGKEITGLSARARNELRRRDIGLVFQAYGLVPLMTALENVEFGLRIAGSSKAGREEAEWALERVGMKERMKHRPPELSGGEQQRVAVARAIVHKPKLLIADEPTAELDSRMGLQVIRLFRELVNGSGMTILLTTHDPDIMELVDHVIALEDGKIVSQTIKGSPVT
ncbi:macrolide ABC transporter ATP-binding protein [Paenibacillus sp. PK3_47]|uniref:ABC transporter ATP-binding protein n=1 Tax=Paenibacillus sp. PK3_47 TaxID=2072642 RepID=UPI00201D431E|nr:ABC transporter ATP-binding protein [Paenibacillus sp. PK3_47]UQZ35471.1 macrolide ABC transporter ATP-binding protein [Paenibacillus sp. PK3_47]